MSSYLTVVVWRSGRRVKLSLVMLHQAPYAIYNSSIFSYSTTIFMHPIVAPSELEYSAVSESCHVPHYSVRIQLWGTICNTIPVFQSYHHMSQPYQIRLYDTIPLTDCISVWSITRTTYKIIPLIIGLGRTLRLLNSLGSAQRYNLCLNTFIWRNSVNNACKLRAYQNVHEFTSVGSGNDNFPTQQDRFP